MVGSTIAHYIVGEKLGEGGMGVVHKAEDSRLRRTVALKFLSSRALQDPELKELFIQEARAAAALDHPNICTVHAIEEVDGQSFIAMAYVEGRSLADKLKSNGPLEIAEAVDLAKQIAEGLRAAHEKGVVHRDIKPANLLITDSGQVKIVDFGLAQLGGSSPTGSARMLGTAAYMSPQQAVGAEVDHRTDIWSLGGVLSEMLSGRPPFSGLYTDAVLYAISHEEPEPVSARRKDIPTALERIVSRALAKDVQDRYQNIGEMLRDLSTALESPVASADTAVHDLPSEPRECSVAVLPFANMNRDEESEFLSDGITEDIMTALSKVEGMRVVARNSAFQFKGKTPTLSEVGETLKVDSVVSGSVRRMGKRLRITAELSNVSNGYELWPERFDRVMEDVFEVQDEISQAIVDGLRVELCGGPSPKLVERWTQKPEAYRLYLLGRYHLNARTPKSVQSAIECFEHSAREDPSAAPPLAALAEACTLVAGSNYGISPDRESFDKARQAAARAVQLDEQCAEAHTASAILSFRADWDWVKAERQFRRAIELNEGLATLHHNYGLFLVCLLRFDEAIAAVRRALVLDPLSPIISTALARVLHFARRYEESLEQSLQTTKLHPGFGGAYFDLCLTYTRLRRYEEALETNDRNARAGAPPAVIHLMRLQIFAEMGEMKKARNEFDALISSGDKLGVGGNLYMGMAHAALGDVDEAFKMFEESLRIKEPQLVYAQCEPSIDLVREDPRYNDLIRGIGFPVGN